MDTPQPAERRLIINADDFGLTEGVNRAVLELNTAEVVPSATLMATGRAFREAVHSAFVQTSLGVGCHVVLVDGRPELHPAELPTLAPEGRLRSSLTTFMVDLFGGRIASREIEREAIAQIRQLQSAGITVTHLDTHKHTHLAPPVLDAVARLGLGAAHADAEGAGRHSGYAEYAGTAQRRATGKCRPHSMPPIEFLPGGGARV